jgi:anti-sigma B factor antagonist
MKTYCEGDTLIVSGIKELDAANGRAFQEAVSSAWCGELKYIEIDLSETVFLDSCGLGALVWLRKLVAGSNGRVRLLNPAPSIQQILELTRLYRLFDIVKRQEALTQ